MVQYGFNKPLGPLGSNKAPNRVELVLAIISGTFHVALFVWIFGSVIIQSFKH